MEQRDNRTNGKQDKETKGPKDNETTDNRTKGQQDKSGRRGQGVNAAQEKGTMGKHGSRSKR